MMVHENSRDAYYEELESGKIDTRTQAVLNVITLHEGLTARQIARKLGFDDLNAVRPRLTELKESYMVTEGEKVKCDESGKSVSTFYLKRYDNWQDILRVDK